MDPPTLEPLVISPALVAMLAKFVNETGKSNEQPGGPLYHYTSVSGLIRMLQSGAISATDVRCMNDTRELEHGLALIETAIKVHEGRPFCDVLSRAMAHQNFQSLLVFATSFSTERDLLSQWRAYSDDGAGCALGFHAQALLLARPLEWPFDLLTKAVLYRIIYAEKEQQRLAAEIVQKALGVIELLAQGGDPAMLIPAIATALSPVFGSFAARCKSDAFEEEAEWRIMIGWSTQSLHEAETAQAMPTASFRAGRYGLTPYLSLPFDRAAGIAEIVLGPKAGADAEKKVRMLLANTAVTSWSTLPIRRAAASYR